MSLVEAGSECRSIGILSFYYAFFKKWRLVEHLEFELGPLSRQPVFKAEIDLDIPVRRICRYAFHIISSARNLVPK